MFRNVFFEAVKVESSITESKIFVKFCHTIANFMILNFGMHLSKIQDFCNIFGNFTITNFEYALMLSYALHIQS